MRFGARDVELTIGSPDRLHHFLDGSTRYRNCEPSTEETIFERESACTVRETRLVNSMLMDFKTLQREALDLSPADRAKLAHELLDSLESLSEAELERLWLDESARRAGQLDNGEVQLVPGRAANLHR